MGGRVLGTEVHGVVADLPVLDALFARLLNGALGWRGAVHADGIGGVGEVGVDGYEGSALDGGHLFSPPRGDLGESADRRHVPRACSGPGPGPGSGGGGGCGVA